jgi:hypothetical protein
MMQATENEELAHKAHNEIVRAASKLLDEGLPIGLVINALLTEAFNLGQHEVTEEERKMRAAPAALAQLRRNRERFRHMMKIIDERMTAVRKPEL